MDIDRLKLFRGDDIKISNHITIHQPDLRTVCNYGEKEYFNMIHTLTSVGADLKWQLDEIGIDYTKISDFELFYSVLIQGYSQEQTSIIFGDLDFSKFEIRIDRQNDNICLVQQLGIEKIPETLYIDENTIIVDEYTYMLIMEYLRAMHNLSRNNQIPANESTRQILIEDARDEYLANKDKPYQSQLLNYISAMVNSEGFKYNHEEVWDVKIYAFLDSVKRISRIKSSNLLLQSGYSGYGVDLKKINQKEIDWIGELN